MFIFDSYAIIKLSMQSTSLIPSGKNVFGDGCSISLPYSFCDYFIFVLTIIWVVNITFMEP